MLQSPIGRWVGLYRPSERTRNCIKAGEVLTNSVVASFRRIFPTTKDVLQTYIKHHSIRHPRPVSLLLSLALKLIFQYNVV